MQPALNKPASPSISMSLPAGLERDKSRQRDLRGLKLETTASPEDQAGEDGDARFGWGEGSWKEARYRHG